MLSQDYPPDRPSHAHYGDTRANPGKPVPRHRVNSAAPQQRYPVNERFLGPEPAAFDQSSNRIHESGQAGVGGPDEGTPLFDRPEAREDEVLLRFNRFAVPGVIGQVEHHIRNAVVTPASHERADLSRE